MMPIPMSLIGTGGSKGTINREGNNGETEDDPVKSS